MMKYRSRWVAVLLSFGCPCGLAQIYNGQIGKAAVFFVAYWSIMISTLLTGLATSGPGCGVMILMSLVLVLVSMIDSIRNAGHDVSLRWYNTWYFYAVFYVATIVAISGMKAGAVIEAFSMPARSMQPSILPGDKFMVDKREKVRTELHRGDLIVFRYPLDRRIKFIKRLIGLPGDRIRTEGTDLYHNGEKLVHSLIKQEKDLTVLDEGFDSDGYNVQYMPYRAYADQEYIVPEGQLFVMGDNRDNSADSREWGFVPMADVIGTPTFFYWSSDHSRIGSDVP